MASRIPAVFGLLAVLALASLLVLGNLGCGGGSVSSQKLAETVAGKNVVIVLFDAAAAGHFSFLGYERKTTPHLDAIAQDGIVFENAYAQASATPLSVFSLFTSRYPIPDKQEHAREDQGEIAPLLLPGLPTIASQLGRKLPQRAAFVSNQWISEKLGYAQGFTEFHELWRTGQSLTQAAFTAEEVTDRALSWALENGDAPFLMYVHYFEPHAPYMPPPPYDTKFDPEFRGWVDGSMQSLEPFRLGLPRREVVRNTIGLYDGNLAYADAQLGRLVDGLRETGEWDDTLFVFASDHGEAFWQHGKRGHSDHMYEEYVKVPLLMRIPGLKDLSGLRVATTVELVDVMPTLMDLYGIEAPDRLTAGESLAPLMVQGGSEAPGIAFMRNHDSRAWEYGLRRGGFKFIYYFDRQPNELFDLRIDPGETVNMLESKMPPKDYDLETVTRSLWADYKEWVADGHGVDSEIASSFSGVDSLDAETIERLKAIGYFN